MKVMSEPKKTHNYPGKRAKARRSRDSYRCKNPEGRQRQLDNLAKGRGRRGKRKPKISGAKVTAKDLKGMDIITFSTDVLGISFKKRPCQETILRAQYGLPLDAEQLEIYDKLTHGQKYRPGYERSEGVYVLGARSGKSFLASIIAIFESTVRAPHFRKFLNPGEIGYVIIVATRLLQAQQIIGASCLRMLEESKIAHFIDYNIATEIVLTNNISIMSMPCSSTAGRGLPIPVLLCDELAWWRQESPKSDINVFRALRPRMSQFKNAKFLAISTPASKQGLLYDLYKEGISREQSTPARLVVHGETLFVNPEVDHDFLKNEEQRDPDNYDLEYLAHFAEQVDSFFPADKLRECFTLLGDVPPNSQYRYHCAVDQSGLSGRDRFAMSISHKQKDGVIVDIERSWATKSGDAIISEIKETVKPYGISSISVDRYAGGWVREAFERQGFEVTVRDLLPPIYVNLKSLVISNRVSLPDYKGLREGLLRTVGYYGKSNKLAIGHERTSEGHGDEADSAATAVWMASSKPMDGYFSKALAEMDERILQEQQNG